MGCGGSKKYAAVSAVADSAASAKLAMHEKEATIEKELVTSAEELLRLQAEVLAQHAELEAAMARNKKTENGKFANQWKSIALSLMKETRLAKAAREEAALARETVMAKEEIESENKLLRRGSVQLGSALDHCKSQLDVEAQLSARRLSDEHQALERQHQQTLEALIEKDKAYVERGKEMSVEMPMVIQEREKAKAESRRQSAALALFKATGFKDDGQNEATLKARLNSVKNAQPGVDKRPPPQQAVAV